MRMIVIYLRKHIQSRSLSNWISFGLMILVLGIIQQFL